MHDPYDRERLMSDDPEADRAHAYPPTHLNVVIHYRRANCCQRLVLLLCAVLMFFGFMAVVGMIMCGVRFGGQPDMSVGRCWQWMWLWR
jgi:hypothetical protein